MHHLCRSSPLVSKLFFRIHFFIPILIKQFPPLPWYFSVQSRPLPTDSNQADLSALDLYLRTLLEELVMDSLFLPWFHTVVGGVGVMGVGMLRRNWHIKALWDSERKAWGSMGVFSEIIAGTKEYRR